jgi:hypothetical protein
VDLHGVASAEVNHATRATPCEQCLQVIQADNRVTLSSITELDESWEPVHGDVEDRVVPVPLLTPLLYVVVKLLPRRDIAMDEVELPRRPLTDEFHHRPDGYL